MHSFPYKILCFTLTFFISFSSYASEKNKDEVLWEAIGFLAEQSTYLTFLATTTLADAYASGTYDRSNTLKLLDNYMDGSMAAKAELTTLLSLRGLDN